jgi:hypothetical protein
MSEDDKKPAATLIALPGGGNVDVLRDGIRNMKANQELLIEYWKIETKIRRARYLAYIEAGFTAAEALELVKP